MPAKETPPVTIPDFARWKREGRRISVLTAYDYTMARLLDASGVDCLLVGDTLGMVVQGRSTTLGVTLDQMVYHAEMVARAAQRALVVADLPFGSYQVSREQAIVSASRFLKETQCQAVKLEGGRRMAATIRALVEADIPVMGHVGLTPQSVRKLGGYKVQRDAEEILDDARAVAEAGAFSIVLECVPTEIAARVTAEIPIPTIGIGAGPDCDGQVLVTPDLLGLFEGFRPKFVRRYADLGEPIRKAAREYVADVQAGRFPERRRELSMNRLSHIQEPSTMSTSTAEELTRKKCVPCEGGVPTLSPERGRRPAREPAGLGEGRGRPADPPRVAGQELHGRDRLLQQGRRAGRGGRPPPRPPPRRLPERRHRDLDPRHRRPLGERLHPGRQDRRHPDRREEKLNRGIFSPSPSPL